MQKKHLFSSLLLVMFAMLSTMTVTSCNDDDDDNGGFNTTGIYKGVYEEPLPTLIGSKEGNSVLEKNKNGTYNLLTLGFTLPNFYNGFTVVTDYLTLSDLELKENGADAYDFQADYGDIKLKCSWNETNKNNPDLINFSAHVKGTVSKTGNLKYTLDINHANTFVFTLEFDGKR